MRRAKAICYDRLPPQAPLQQQRVMTIGGRVRAISPKGKQWVNGSTLRIRFLEGTTHQKDMVRAIAPQWTQHANLEFVFTDDPTAEIRVSFDPNDGAWSYVGLDNKGIPAGSATLNLGWQDQAVILHEFGHMLGLAHEHQNPDGGIIWNEQVVIDDLAGPPNYWPPEVTRHNVLNKYTVDQIHGTVFDPHSVMLYAFPDEWTQNTGPTSENPQISAMDRAFVASAKMYPGRGNPAPSVPVLVPGQWTAAAIDAFGEEDLFAFTLDQASRVVVETSGQTDVVLVLLGPDSDTAKIAEDDDSGAARNARLELNLLPGRYLAAVRHYHPQGRGAYRIRMNPIGAIL